MNAVKSLTLAAIPLLAVMSSPGFASDMKTWQQGAAKKIFSSFTYPRSAVAKEIEGRALVKITVAADGVISNYEITQPSGEAVLDREIPKIIDRASPLPALPASKDSITFVLPMTWTLD